MIHQTDTATTRRPIRAFLEHLDIVDLASADSFPASDAPPWTTGPSRPARRGDARRDHPPHGTAAES